MSLHLCQKSNGHIPVGPHIWRLPRWLRDKESACNAEVAGHRCRFDPWVVNIPWRMAQYSCLQHSCLENPTDRGAWRAAAHRVAESRTWLKRLSTHAMSFVFLSPTLLWPLLRASTWWVITAWGYNLTAGVQSFLIRSSWMWLGLQTVGQ